MTFSPTQLRSIVGHDLIIDALRRRYSEQRFPHAILFEGPRGVGKRTTAEALAALLLCHTPQTPADACEQCPSCRKLSSFNHGDLHIIKPNERNNIVLDSIRRTERSLQLHPLEGPRKVVLIYEAHRMGPPAQNGLLKTLEEPPSQTHIILISDQPNTLLPTIRSRCQKVRFSPLSPNHVEKIIAHQLPELPPDQQFTLACLSGGAPGKALRLDPEKIFAQLDQIKTLDTLFDPHNMEGARRLNEHAAGLAKNRPELVKLLDLWLAWTRDQLLLATEGSVEQIAHRGHFNILSELAQQRGVQTVLARAEAILHTQRQLDLPYNLNATMLVEQLFLMLLNQLSGTKR